MEEERDEKALRRARGVRTRVEATCTGKVIQVVVEEDRATRVPRSRP